MLPNSLVFVFAVFRVTQGPTKYQVHCTEYTRYVHFYHFFLWKFIFFFTIFRICSNFSFCHFLFEKAFVSDWLTQFVSAGAETFHLLKQPISERSDFKNVREHSKCQQKIPTFSSRRKVLDNCKGLIKLFHHKE